MAGILRNRTRGIIQMWKRSGVKQALQDDLPLYLGKLQDVVQQVQMELQKPLTTLKDAYYDATLKPFDEVWQQKTEERLRKLQAFIPTIVKDVWLMEPIQVSLRALKTGLDVVTQQMLNWIEAKSSRAVRKLQKSLSNLYSFSARNCSMVVKLPVMPKVEPTLHLANLTNYLIEEKLMKPLRGLYNINLVAEYYRFKRSMMESPFEHHALLIGNKHLRTFDGQMYRLTSKCSALLAKDFVHDAFTVILNVNSQGDRSLHVNMNGTTVVIYPKQKFYKRFNYSLLEESCQSFDIPLEENGFAIRRESDHVEVSSTKGALFSCDLRYGLCTLTLDGWHHGASAGLLGTNDNEAGNEWLLPDHSYADSLQEFIRSWQVSNSCIQLKRTDKPCLNASSSPICKAFFQDSDSLFRNCFKVVDPEPFYDLCTIDTCEPDSVKVACTLAAAFVHLCNRNFVPLQMPLQCDGELRLRDHSLPKAAQ
ncbi:apolipophorins-like isoform X2 [Elgaria multicarinata webbii]|uniref:apolipophorins-like isoform X2 n=1 Tax=Elgaria multicarinata webbii TaxID=159646 RepID=UPI002FCCEA11